MLIIAIPGTGRQFNDGELTATSTSNATCWYNIEEDRETSG